MSACRKEKKLLHCCAYFVVAAAVALATGCGDQDKMSAMDDGEVRKSFERPSDASPPQMDPVEFKSFVERAISELRGVGLSIAIVKDGETILLEGYGLSDIDEGVPYTPQTVQNIGSVSKLINADAVSLLVQEDALSLTDPIKKHLPYFQMKDDWVSDRATLDDILSYRLGTTISAIDNYYLHVASGAVDETREDYVRRFKEISHAGDLRSEWVYGNELFAVAAGVVEAVSDKRYSDFLQDNIFMPLGMRSTGLGFDAYVDAELRASFHAVKDNDIVKISPEYFRHNHIGFAPAGGVFSNAEDMAEWIKFHLGAKEGPLNSATLNQIHSVRNEFPGYQSLLDNEGNRIFDDSLNVNGLGWSIYYYRGRGMHGWDGLNAGVRAAIGIIPDENLGVWVQSNSNNSHAIYLVDAILYGAVDYILGKEGTYDWIDHFKLKAVTESQDSDARRAEFLENANCSKEPSVIELNKLVGSYSAKDGLHGVLKLEASEGYGIITFGGYRDRLLPCRDSAFLLKEENAFVNPENGFALRLAKFTVGGDGHAASFEVSSIYDDSTVTFYRTD